MTTVLFEILIVSFVHFDFKAVFLKTLALQQYFWKRFKTENLQFMGRNKLS